MNLLVQPLELPPAERTRQNRAAPPRPTFCRRGKNSVGGLADLAAGVRLRRMSAAEDAAESVGELGGVDPLLGLGSPWNVAEGIVAVTDFPSLLGIGSLQRI